MLLQHVIIRRVFFIYILWMTTLSMVHVSMLLLVLVLMMLVMTTRPQLRLLGRDAPPHYRTRYHVASVPQFGSESPDPGAQSL